MSFVVLKSFFNYVDAHLLLTRLQSEEIDCWLRNENTATVMPLWNTAIGGIQLMVRKTQWPRAAQLLKEIEDGHKEQICCPRCDSRDVEFINTIRKPVNWLSAAVTFFLGDYAVMPEQRYHCFACGEEWKKAEE